MSSYQKRKEQVQQFKKAHFPFGFQDNKTLSQYKHQYPQRPLQINNNKIQRKSNFTIGSENPLLGDNSYLSEFKQKYVENPGYAKRQPIKDTDQHNIIMGFDQVSNQTNYRDQFKQKTTQRSKKIDQRVVSVQLGGAETDFSTTYGKTFTGTQVAQVKKIDGGIGKTNLVFGYDPTKYTTSSIDRLNKDTSFK